MNKEPTITIIKKDSLTTIVFGKGLVEERRAKAFFEEAMKLAKQEELP